MDGCGLAVAAAHATPSRLLREIVAGASLGDVGGLLLREAGVGLLYAAVGLVAIRLLEASSRRTASLERL